METRVLVDQGQIIGTELALQYAPPADAQSIAATTTHIVEELMEDMGDLMITDPVTTGMLIGMNQALRLQAVHTLYQTKQAPKHTKRHKTLDKFLPEELDSHDDC
jgi:uncharacterized protein with ACT and thioredoxin-like domain